MPRTSGTVTIRGTLTVECGTLAVYLSAIAIARAAPEGSVTRESEGELSYDFTYNLDVPVATGSTAEDG